MSITYENGIRRSPYADVKLPNANVWLYFHKKFEKYGNRYALICNSTLRKLTFTQYKEKVLSWGHYLQRQHKSGPPLSVVAIFSPNTLEYPIFVMGCVAAGISFTTLLSTFTPDEVANQLNDSKAGLVVVHHSLVECMQNALPKINHKIKVLVNGFEAERENNFQAILNDDNAESSITPLKTDPSEILSILYTSGTTGKPKGVAMCNAAYSNYIAITEGIHFDGESGDQQGSDDSNKDATDDQSSNDESLLMTTTPLCHMAGICFIINAVYHGITLVAGTYNNGDQILKDIHQFQSSWAMIYPDQIMKIIRSPLFSKEYLKSLKFIASGASKPRSEDVRILLENSAKDVDFKIAFGMTEIIGGTTRTYDVNGPCGPGMLYPNVEAKVIDISTGKLIRDDTVGELLIRSPMTFSYYLNKPEETKLTRDKDGWVRTGDLCKFDEKEGFVYVSRIKELIKYYTQQVSPTELEEIIGLLPAVKEVGVLGIPDEEAGELTKAVVVVKENCKISEEEIHQFMKKKLAPHKQLFGGIQFAKEIPRNLLGKISRVQLKKLYG